MFGVNRPMEVIEWGLESIDGMIVLNFSSVQSNSLQDTLNNACFISSDQVSPYDNQTYRIVVRGVDLTGEAHILKSNGTSVTTKGLIPGLVRDRPIPNLDL